MRTSVFFGAKNFGIFEIYGVSARTREVQPVRIFCGQGGRGGQFFAILCGRLTAPKYFYVFKVTQYVVYEEDRIPA